MAGPDDKQRFECLMMLSAFAPLGPVTVGQRLPLHLCAVIVAAGFPSPADDVAAKRIDLNEILVSHPQATFLFRVSGTSMIDAGIHDGDVVVVNRALKPKHGQIVLAAVENEFTVKYLHTRNGQVKLKAANPTFPDIIPRDGETLVVWGVVTSGITIFVKV